MSWLGKPTGPDRVLRSRGPVAHQVRLLIYATLAVYFCLGTIVALSVIYVTATQRRLSNNQTQIRALAHENATRIDTIRKLVAQGVDAKDALCAFSANLRDQVVASKKYLEDVKSGRRQPIPNISNADIEAGIVRQKKTIQALGAKFRANC